MEMNITEFLKDKECDDNFNCLHILKDLDEAGYIIYREMSFNKDNYAVFARRASDGAYVFIYNTRYNYFVHRCEIEEIREICEEFENE